MTRSALFPLAAFPLLATLGLPAETTIRGHLIDVACAVEDEIGADEVARHDKMCLEMTDCAASGYAVLTPEGRLYRFDANGNDQAKKLLAATDKADDWRITVTGDVQDDTIRVASLTLDL